MTKTNFFGDTIFTPSDSATDFSAWLSDNGHGDVTGAVISKDDAFGWCAEVETSDTDGYAGQVHGFNSDTELTRWLIEAGVPEREISQDGY